LVSDGPDDTRMAAFISLAITLARVVLPSPGGHKTEYVPAARRAAGPQQWQSTVFPQRYSVQQFPSAAWDAGGINCSSGSPPLSALMTRSIAMLFSAIYP